MSVTRRGAVLTAAAGVAGAAGAWLAGRPLLDRAAAGPSRTVAVSAGPRRSVYLGWTTTLAEQVHLLHPDLTLDVRDSSGSLENLERLGAGQVTLAVASADAATLALRGQPPFRAPIGVTALARVYDDYVHLVVRDDSSVHDLAGLSGRRVAVGPPGSGTSLVAERLLADQGLTVRREPLDVVDAGLALQSRQLAAMFWLGGLPTRAVTELAGRVRIRLLPLGDVASRLRARHGAAYRPATIPPSTYGRPEGVPTVASANLLLCRGDADDPLVRAVLDTVFRRRDVIAAAQPAGNALDGRAAIATDPLPLHPAAQAYYRAGKP